MNIHSKAHQCPCPAAPAFPSLSVICGLPLEGRQCLWVLSPAFPALSSFLPSVCQQITSVILSLEASYLSFPLGAAVFTLPGKVACFFSLVRVQMDIFCLVLSCSSFVLMEKDPLTLCLAEPLRWR